MKSWKTPLSTLAFVNLVKASPWNSLTKWLPLEKGHTRLLKEGFDNDYVRSSALGDMCLNLIETSVDDDSIDCTCNLTGAGEMQLICTTTKCTLCDRERHTCAVPSFSLILNPGISVLSSTTDEMFMLQYISGNREHLVQIKMVGCDSMSDFCSGCRAFIDNEECNSCFLCGIDEVDFDIDCENVAEDSSFRTCDASLTVENENGAFVGGTKFLECVPPLPNAYCEGANSPMFPNESVIKGSTITSSYDGEPECLREWRSPGMWYLVVGTGDTFRVDTCSNFTNFDTEISLYRGICGVSLECMGGNDDACSEVASALQWQTEIGVLYYIKVHGHGAKSMGNFGVTFRSFPSPVNGMCRGAESLSIETSSTGSTVGAAAIYDDAPNCDTSNSQLFPSIWYTVQGNGKAITASTCGPGTEIPTSISVYIGVCSDVSNLECVARGEKDYSCLEQKIAGKVTWFASVGIEYYIQVVSEDGFGGTVELKLTESPKESNFFCQTASEVLVDQMETDGLLEFNADGEIVDPDVPCGHTFETVGAWYSVVGDGRVFSATTCSSILSFDSSLSVFRGSCEDLICVGWDSASFGDPLDSIGCPDSSSFFSGTVRWRTQPGEVYHILIQSIDSSPNKFSGNFSLSITSVEVPENDLCANAESMHLFDKYQVSGTTAIASQDRIISGVHSNSHFDACHTISSGADLWYKVLGTGSLIEASTCHPDTNFDTQISVYASLSSTSLCDALECISTNDDDNLCEDNSGASKLSWFAKEGVLYLIRIHGFDQSVGEFVLTLLPVGP